MKKINIALACLLAAAAISLWADQQDGTIVVSMVIGDVKVKMNDAGKWEKAKPGMVLSETSVLQTGKSAKVKILFREGNSEILIPGEKTVKISDVIAKKKSLQNDKNRLLLNKVKLKLYKDTSKDDLDSPSAVAGVRGADVSKKSNGESSKPEEMFWDE